MEADLRLRTLERAERRGGAGRQFVPRGGSDALWEIVPRGLCLGLKARRPYERRVLNNRT